MAPLTYVGRAPDSDGVIVPKSYADTLNSSLAVTTNFVNQQISAQAQYLTTQSYVDATNATVAKKAAVDTADALYIPVTQLNVAGGIAGLDSSGTLKSTQMPASNTLITDRVTQCYSVASPTALGGILGGTLTGVTGAVGTMLFSAAVTATSTNIFGSGATQLASIPIPDPGWPWRPWPFAWVAGNSSGASQPATRMQGTNNYGKLAVIPPTASGSSPTIYGLGICGSSYYTNIYRLFPYAGANQTPTNVPPINGALELDLWGSCWSGTTYTFLPTNFCFFILVVPAI